ncbi:hypothetical protein AB0E69_29370 [Kribbella sp. NPDC026611]|uniref:hypothetical protein n=1 Tax=Kribbella sp. NPDC026611 TaxID=3154911 RepID=UPI0034046E71
MLVAYFWEQEDAETVARLLHGEVRRGRFQGEDDDDDHPWVVVLRPSDDLERVVAEHDGWVETLTNEPRVVPAPLPQEPQRFKRGPAVS